MFKNSTIFLSVALAISLPTILQADEIPPSYTPTVHQILVNQATLYHAPIPLMRAIITCESGNDPLAHKLSSKENSWGLVQINLKAHPEITRAQAIDPEFAISYLASNLSTHESWWTCAKMVK